MSASTLPRSGSSPDDTAERRLSGQTNCLASGHDCTEVVIQRHLDRLAEVTDESAASAIARDLLAGAVNRLHCLCASMLYRSYPRLTRPPINLRPDELLSS